MQVGTKRTITKMLWTFAEPLRLVNFTEGQRRHNTHYPDCPKVWKIEVEIDPIRGRDGYFPRGFVNLYVTFDTTTTWEKQRRLNSQIMQEAFQRWLWDEILVRMTVCGYAPKAKFQFPFKAVRNQNDTTTAMKFCVDLFPRLGIVVTKGPEISQHTLVLKSYNHTCGCEWINLGEQLWADFLRKELRKRTA